MASTTAPAGRILRLKHGYNPNSSSIGSIVFAMPASLLALTVAFGAATGLVCAAFLDRRPPRGGGPKAAAGERDPSPKQEGVRKVEQG
ncbi:MAG: hypothetical protein HY744_23575 [Deltaproteobacteria bacterium]|nr:hypothetical protein [Deltaproteobacteria bacterium]